MHTDNFLVYVKAEDIHADIGQDIETRFDTSNYDVQRPLPISKNKKVRNLIKGELVDKIMKNFIALRPILLTSLTNDGYIDKKAKGTKKCVIKREIKIQDYNDCLEN